MRPRIPARKDILSPHTADQAMQLLMTWAVGFRGDKHVQIKIRDLPESCRRIDGWQSLDADIHEDAQQVGFQVKTQNTLADGLT